MEPAGSSRAARFMSRRVGELKTNASVTMGPKNAARSVGWVTKQIRKEMIVEPAR